MKRCTIAQTLLCTTAWRIRPSIPIAQQRSSIPVVVLLFEPPHRSYHNGARRQISPTKTTWPIFQSWWGLCRQNNDNSITTSTRAFVALRGGGSDGNHATSDDPPFTVLSDPAPGSPFHYAFPVHDLALAKEFYGNVLGCVEGRSSTKWQDYSLHGHQIVAHWVGDTYRCHDYYNPVDGDEVPVPHTGLALTVDQFHELANRLRNAGVQFIIEPHLRFKGMPGEQYTMFFKDPSGNNLEFKAMTNPQNLFAKYNVDDK